jgi:hypothetical protein
MNPLAFMGLIVLGIIYAVGLYELGYWCEINRSKTAQRLKRYLFAANAINAFDIIFLVLLLGQGYLRWRNAEPLIQYRGEALIVGAVLGRYLFLLSQRLQRSRQVDKMEDRP